MNARAAAALALLIGALTNGCTAVVEGVEPPTCSSNTDCEILNELDDIGIDACERYQCGLETERCELGARDDDRDGWIAAACASEYPDRRVDCDDTQTGGGEVCNGLDDACDGVIDEAREADDGSVTTVLPRDEAGALASATGARGQVGYGVRSGELFVTESNAEDAEGEARLFVISAGMGTPAEAMTYSRAAHLEDLSNTQLADGCHLRGSDGVDPVACDFRDLTVGVASEGLFYASISRTGCASGVLRIGWAERSDPTTMIERGPARRSNIFAGVDVRPEGTELPCTGASRSSGLQGATSPSVVSAEGLGEQALVAFLAASDERDECGGDPVDVEALGVHLIADPSDASVRWLTGSNEGVPQALGQTTGGGRPGIGVWESVGYLVGWGRGARVELAFVGPMARPAYSDGMSDSRVGVETQALSVTSLGGFDTDGPVDDVRIAFGSIRVGGVDVGITWRESCGTESSSVGFRQIFLARDEETVRFDDEASQPPVSLSSRGPVGGPNLSYAFAGLLADGITRPDGRPTGAPGNVGGWYVAWARGPADASESVATRVSEADGQPVDASPFPLAETSELTAATPIVYRTSESEISYVTSRSGAEVSEYHGGRLSCSP